MQEETCVGGIRLHALDSSVGLFENRAWQGLQAAKNMAGRRLKFVTPSRRKIRIAVCVSGQLRGYAKAFPTWKDTLLQHVDYDLFVHSWARVGRSGIGPSRHVFPFEGEQFSKIIENFACRSGSMNSNLVIRLFSPLSPIQTD